MASPPEGALVDTKFFNFRVSSREINNLDELSKETGRSKAQILRELIARAEVEPRIRITDEATLIRG